MVDMAPPPGEAAEAAPPAPAEEAGAPPQSESAPDKNDPPTKAAKRRRGKAKEEKGETAEAKEEAPKEEAPKEETPKAPKRVQGADVTLLANAMLGLNTGLPVPFHSRFAVLVDSELGRKPVLVGGGDVLQNVKEQAVVDAAIVYCHRVLGGAWPGPPVLPKDAKAAVEMWRAMARPIQEDEITAVRELSEPGYTWHRLPWDIEGATGETPTFDEMMSRTGNAEALMAWIGGLTLPGTNRQQYVYLYGEGGEGKGALSRFLHQLLARSYHSENDAKRNQFWTSGLVGKRLVVFPDFDDPRFPDSGLFKSLTGGDPVRVEEKGKQPFTIPLVCLFLFMSNGLPGLSEGEATRRRAILCGMQPLPEGTAVQSDAAYGARLWSEGAAWLAKCRKKWHELAGKTGRIVPKDTGILEQVIDANAEPFLDVVGRWLDVADGHRLAPDEMQQICRAEGMKDFRMQRPFHAFLEKRFGIRKVRARDGATREWVYVGAKVREARRAALEKF